VQSAFQIRCAATGGFPAPQLSWSEPAEAEVDFTAEPEIVTMRNDHTTDVYHTVKYRASLRDNNTIISCIATQLVALLVFFCLFFWVSDPSSLALHFFPIILFLGPPPC
jgi:hypothetical protein